MLEKIREVQEYLTSKYFERDEVIEGCLAALGCRQHVLLLGPPGTGKSEMIEDLTACIAQAGHFSWLMSRFTTPEELFGPVSLKGLENDEYRRITAGKLPEAHVAFLDEVFKSSSAIANANLSLMDNRRLFYNGRTPVRTPLVSLFGASNELPEGEEEREMSAFSDRFALRYELGYVEERDSFLKMSRRALNLDPVPERPVLTLGELKSFQETAARVKVDSQIIEAVTEIRYELKKEGVKPSDRRFMQSYSILKAVAALSGETEVYEDHLSILAHCYWTHPEEKNTVRKAVRKVANPALTRMQEILEEAEEIYKNAVEEGSASAGAEANAKFKTLSAELNSLCGKIKNGKAAEKYRNRFNEMNAEVLKKCLGVEFPFMNMEGAGVQ